MLRLRRRISGFLTISALAVIGALSAAMLGFSPAQAHTVTGTIVPTADGFHTAWPNGVARINETGTTNCSTGGSITESTSDDRESFTIDLTTVPNGATITSVDVFVGSRSDSTAGGTFKTFTRLDGNDADAADNIITATASANNCNETTQTVNVNDTVKAVGTALEIGVVKTSTNTAAVRVGALRAIVSYNRAPSAPTLSSPADATTTNDRTPTFDWNDDSVDPDGSDGPFTYEIDRAALVSSTCDWPNKTTNTVSASTFTPGANMAFGTHCWRVRTLDHGGLAGPYATHRTITIQPADVSAVITAADKVYDGNTDAGYTCDVVGEQSGDNVTCDGTHPATFNTATVGTGKTVTATGLSLSGTDAGSYNLTNTTDQDTADITKATLSVDANNANKDYGDADPTFTYTLTGFVNGESQMTAAGLTGTANCTRDAGETVAGSPFEINCAPGALTATNYDFETGDPGELTINQATLSVDADDKTKDYGDTDPDFTYTFSGFKNGEDETSAGVTGDAACDREPGATVAGSPYTITCAPGTLAADNYVFETGETGELTIEAVEVSAEITASNKEYDGTTDAEYTCEVSGELSGDDVTCDGTHPAMFDDANVGTNKNVTASNLALSGDDAGNYTLPITTDDDEADITKATLSVDAENATKDYGDDDPTFEYSLSGFVGGDDESNAAGLTGSPDCTRDPGETVVGSPYEITCASGSLTADNYDFETGETGDRTIEKADPNCTIEGYTGTYDGDPHGAEGTCAGVDDEGPLPGLELGDTFTDVPGGTATWTFSDESGNYDDDSDSVEIVINAATLSVDADDKEKDFGDLDPPFTYTLSGFVGGEDEDSAGVTGEAACDRESGETVAGSPYTITCAPGTLAAANYTFETGETGELTIGAGEVSAEITAEDKDYDGTTDAQYTCEVVDAQSGDDVSCDGDDPATFDDANAGTGKTVTATNLFLSGDDAGNYTLTNTEDTDEANIAKVTLAIDADDQSKDYGDDDPTFLYTLSGFVNGEDESTAAGLDGTPNCTRDPGETVIGSPYEITCAPGTLVATNYDFATGETGDFTINAASLSVNAENQTKDYGDADPTFTYTLTGFADGEDKDSAGVTGDAACDREAGETVAESPYTITCLPGTLAAANYTFVTGDTGELTIEGAEVEAVITASDKPYDGLVDAEYTCDVEGEASGDDVDCDGDHPAMFDDANAGTGKTVTATNLVLSGDDAGNYTLINAEDTDLADITAATLSVNADDKTKEFGDDDPPLTYTLTGFIAPDDASNVPMTGAGECTRAPGETVAGSPYVITCTPGDLEADNYTFVTGEAGEFTITPDTTVPSVTINQALSQDDPTTDSPIVFDVVFSEDVTGFEDDDVELSGSAGATTADVTGDGAEYTVSVSGMTNNGDVIADVKAAAATDGSNDSTASTSDDNTVEYNLKEFDPGPTATISGTPRVGETLTAGEGSPSPAPDSFEYEWFADGSPIAGADDPTFAPTTAEVGKAITVTVTAVKGGYADASDTSDPTTPVGTLGPKTLLVKAQPVAFAGDRITIRVARLAPREDYTLKFDGEVIKTGKANVGGTVAITFLLPLSTQPGEYTVTAVGSLPDRTGTDMQTVRAPLDLGVTLTKPSVPAGGTQRVQVRNLLHGESVEIRYDGTLVSPSSAKGNSSGGYALTFPVGTTVGSHTVEVKGLYNGRTTTKTFDVTGP